MPRIKAIKSSSKQACDTCKQKFLRVDKYRRHLLKCRRENYDALEPCVRCGKRFPTFKECEDHQKDCGRMCKFRCSEEKFRTRALTATHEKICAQASKSDTQRVMVPPNRYNVSVEDVDDIYKPGLKNHQQQQLQVSDSGLDAFNGFLSDSDAVPAVDKIARHVPHCGASAKT